MTPSQNPRRTVKISFYTEAKDKRGTAKGSQGIGLQGDTTKYLPTKTDPLATDYSYDYRMELLDRFIQMGEPDEQLIYEMFQAFGTIAAIGFGNVVFVSKGHIWPWMNIFRRGGQ